MNIVEVNNITKRFNDKLVLDNVSFNIKKGEIFGLLGPNGAGKSTLINLMVGLLKMDKGQVIIGGNDISKETIKAKQRIGLVPQEIALFEGLNAKENLEYWGGLYGLRGKVLKDRIDEAIEISALKDHLKNPVKKYSGGMKRRLNIAAAMMHHPEVLIMDEPTVGVDPQSRNHIFEVVKRMNKEYSTSIIYTSHYMEEVELLCDNILILDLGKEVAYGSKEELKRMVISDRVIKIKAQGRLDELAFEMKKLPNIRGTEVVDDEIKVICNEALTINEILDAIAEYKVAVRNIGIEEPNLEEVFLTLTGRNLRDEEK
ncbi:ABC transporter ATP-binding protein [Clostridium folliculivorans]|uniref:ABC transporter ATP-binding protein n=1 Tax=Clostridium folliculivorans TaxID=2886038 RepID=A0A9W5Y3J8_9CLOT|nr:ABC transporter ATP-binding protein [Clostridium folliculivorans]GKU25924.1 ABC transporter ATP-binding protein [Clostridium folliculivorans]GKU28010.1 ABC transporter ATP-binding protein [Clostridium folliculivorans]